MNGLLEALDGAQEGEIELEEEEEKLIETAIKRVFGQPMRLKQRAAIQKLIKDLG